MQNALFYLPSPSLKHSTSLSFQKHHLDLSLAFQDSAWIQTSDIYLTSCSATLGWLYRTSWIINLISSSSSSRSIALATILIGHHLTISSSYPPESTVHCLKSTCLTYPYPLPRLTLSEMYETDVHVILTVACPILAYSHLISHLQQTWGLTQLVLPTSTPRLEICMCPECSWRDITKGTGPHLRYTRKWYQEPSCLMFLSIALKIMMMMPKDNTTKNLETQLLLIEIWGSGSC